MSDDISPFKIDVPESQLDDLRRRLEQTRWPEAETVRDWSQGVPLDYARALCDYWRTDYDWRRCEASLNALPQFLTTIDGLDIHFLHVRSPREDAVPLIMTHGWPGSVVEFRKVIGPLTDPAAYGGDPADAFHVVCPSLPGYGFSAKPAESGWGVERIADAWDDLMARLGYLRYGAQGGDWGAGVTTALAVRHPDRLAGIHLNMVVVRPDPDTMSDLTPQEQDALAAMKHYADWDSGYSKQQSTRPQTVGYGLTDSPAGLCAWIVEKFWSWTDNDGDPASALSWDEMLDDVMLYWLPAAGTSSARLYWESFGKLRGQTVDVPVGCSIFPREIFRASRRWAQQSYRDLRYWNEPARGGHFAAFEQPEIFVSEVRAAFRSFR
ncbi:MAG TPA: epoxide hydrolase [Streptosporangiaceae bacterium]|nr:epoxide hydrolase [Streptosporangiaceae bacterium]